jgi:hypothetical protein
MVNSIYEERLYIERLGFHWKRPGEVTQAIRHECETGKKRRLFIIQEPHNYLVKCHNCGYSRHFVQYLREVHPAFYADYKKGKIFSASAKGSASFREEKPTVNKRTREVELPPWQFSRKEAKRRGASHYQGKPCQDCGDQCTRRRLNSVCAQPALSVHQALQE